jgi:hypothetical protein
MMTRRLVNGLGGAKVRSIRGRHCIDCRFASSAADEEATGPIATAAQNQIQNNNNQATQQNLSNDWDVFQSVLTNNGTANLELNLGPASNGITQNRRHKLKTKLGSAGRYDRSPPVAISAPLVSTQTKLRSVNRFNRSPVTIDAPQVPTQQHLQSEIAMLPESTLLRREDSFDRDAYTEYKRLFELVVRKNPKFQRNHTTRPVDARSADIAIQWLLADRPVFPIELPSLAAALNESTTTATELEPSEELRVELFEQRKRFLESTSFDAIQYNLIQFSLSKLAGYCARNVASSSKILPILWAKLKESGLTEKTVLHTILYVAANFAKSNNNNSTDKFGDSALDVLSTPAERAAKEQRSKKGKKDLSDSTWLDLYHEIAAFHDLLYDPVEQTISIRIQMLVAQGKVAQAELLLNEYAEKMELPLRSYTPVLRLYLDQGTIAKALRLYKQMYKSPTVFLDYDTYMILLSGLASQGCFCPDAPSIDGLDQLGYSVCSGPLLFDELVEEMALVVTEVPSASIKRMYDAFAKGFPDQLESTTSLFTLQTRNDPAPASELIVNRISVHHLTGDCTRSGVRLRLMLLSTEESASLRKKLIDYSRILSYEEVYKGKGTGAVSEADVALRNFDLLLDRRKGEPITAILDGANIGYYLQNCEDGRFSFHQLEFFYNYMKGLGENPLIILPYKYATYSKFEVVVGCELSGSKWQILTNQEQEIRNRLIRENKIFIVPRAQHDDLYWIIATLSNQTASRQGRSLYVHPNNAEGRRPGTRPILISNDQMRDHKFHLSDPRLFLRWCSGHIVNFHIRGKKVMVTSPDVFSREIQGNKCADGSTAWHFPIEDTKHDYLCIRIPKKSNE